MKSFVLYTLWTLSQLVNAPACWLDANDVTCAANTLFAAPPPVEPGVTEPPPPPPRRVLPPGHDRISNGF